MASSSRNTKRSRDTYYELLQGIHTLEWTKSEGYKKSPSGRKSSILEGLVPGNPRTEGPRPVQTRRSKENVTVKERKSCAQGPREGHKPAVQQNTA